MYIMCLIIFEVKTEVQNQYPLSLNPVQKADAPIQDRNRSIGPILNLYFAASISCNLRRSQVSKMDCVIIPS